MQYKTHVMKLYRLYSTKHTLRSYMTWIMQYQTHVKKLYALYSTKHTLRSYMRWIMQCHAHVKKHQLLSECDMDSEELSRSVRVHTNELPLLVQQY
jgi:hypothetical protein